MPNTAKYLLVDDYIKGLNIRILSNILWVITIHRQYQSAQRDWLHRILNIAQSTVWCFLSFLPSFVLNSCVLFSFFLSFFLFFFLSFFLSLSLSLFLSLSLCNYTQTYYVYNCKYVYIHIFSASMLWSCPDLRAMSPEQRDAVLAAMSAASEAQQALLGCNHGQNEKSMIIQYV